jgi:hypothetical protein
LLHMHCFIFVFARFTFAKGYERQYLLCPAVRVAAASCSEAVHRCVRRQVRRGCLLWRWSLLRVVRQCIGLQSGTMLGARVTAPVEG